MRSRGAGSVLLRHLGPRVFGPTAPAAASRPLLAGGEGGAWARLLATSAAEAAKEEVAASKDNVASTAAAKAEAAQAAKEGQKNAVVSSYWGIVPAKLVNKDGAEWKWSCFRPWEAYTSDTSIDLTRHHQPKILLDKIAYWTVKSLRVPTDIFFQRRYGCRAMMLETVAAVPGMVGGMLLHLRSLRRFEHSGGWIRALLEEAENERMHLMTFMEVADPKWYERALVLVVQGVFFNAYFVGYLISPKFAHRVVGYLEEEAIHSYTEFLRDLEAGKIDNVPAPRIAIDYWRLPADATLKDVVTVVRADEAHHRDVNHFAAHLHSRKRKSGATLDAMAVPSKDVRQSIEIEKPDLFFCGMTTSDNDQQNYTYESMGEKVSVSRTHAEQLSAFIQMHQRIGNRANHSQLQDDLVEHLWQKFGHMDE